MYESHFNLTTKPFDLLPNPDFLFLSRSHRRAITYLDYGIRERAGFILLTGEVGSGKTTVIRNLIKKHVNNVVLSKVFNTRVDSDQLFAMINDDFGLCVQGKDKVTLLRELNEFLIDQFMEGNQPVLIIDEAQNLAYELLEELRMLSNLETDNAKLLQIILVGQPELRATLASPSLVQLRQRININCHLQPLTRQETELYILHRLEMAGDRNAVTFTPAAVDIIYTYSRGIPRLINIICDFLMLSAYAEETRKIEAEMVADIIGDLDFERHFWGEEAVGIATGGEGEAAGTEFPTLFKTITERLDTMARDAAAFNQKVFREVTVKINAMEESIRSHREATGSLISELRKDLAPPGEVQRGGVLPGAEKSDRGGIIKRMFGI